ncbi:MAG: carboxypeptidase-like regulatory domain-containing protein [Alcanivoracaceae bacterium]|nr:carboxypeptidase-like regulatory domain-containing protein [Alcanivoracaceae bacterium]
MKPRYSVRTPWTVSLAASLILALSGCGGGSGGGGGSTLSGTAAVGAAIVGGTVTARCADGSSFTQAVTTDADGSWSGKIDSSALPCALRVSGGTPPVTLHGYASSTGTTNITPLTDLALAQATSQTPADWFSAFAGTPVDVDTAADQLVDALTDAGFTVPASGNPFTTPFAADGTGWDGLLDDLKQAIEDDPALADYAALVTLVKDGNLSTSLPDAPPPPSFSISGTINGATDSVNVIWETLVDSSIYHDGGNTNGAVSFTYGDGLAEGTNWSVVINTAPAGQTCTVTNGSGTLTADVDNVQISCQDDVVSGDTYSIAGTISGASASVLWETRVDGVFYHDGGDGNGAVTFTPLEEMDSGSNWSVVVTGAPSGQTCEVTNGSGTLSADVDNVSIVCSDIVLGTTYTIEGTISGASGSVLWETRVGGVFYHDGSDGNGAVTFTPLEEMDSGSNWSVVVTGAPAGQTCSVTNGSGTLAGDVSNVSIICEDESDEPAPFYDLSALNLQPSVPVGMVPTAPSAPPTNPASQIEGLFMQLGDAERAKIFAPVPANIETEIGNDIYSGSQYYQITQYTSDQSWLRVIDMGFGADGEANTADDFIQGYTVYPYGPNGVAFSFRHPGPDNMWFSEDDVSGKYTQGQAVYFPTGALLEYEGASEGAVLIIPCLDVGNDGLAFTADDSPGCTLGYQVAVIDGEGNRGQVVSYDAAGADGLWFTADDRVKNYSLLTYNGTSVSVGSVLYNNDGADNIWFTADDNVQQHTMTQLGDDFKPRYTATYNARGGDNVWFTADDVVQAWTYYGYDADGNNIIVATHTDKRSDGVWFTADDFATAVISLKDENGYPVITGQITSGGMGPDGIWLSGDETLSGYSLSEYSADGFQTRRANINNRGADNKWFTADDIPNTFNYWVRELDGEGNIMKQLYMDASLAPAEPVFSDAHINRYRVYNSDRSILVDLSLSGFGADAIPFTEDDTMPWPYSVTTPTGLDQFNRPGPDGLWFTADDVRSGYIVYTDDGLRRTEQSFDDADVLQSYTEIVDATPNSYRLNRYGRNESDGFDLVGYDIIEEDLNGYPLTTIYYTSAGEVSYARYTEHDANGNIVRDGYSFASGEDGIWATSDDFNNYGLSFFNMNGDLVAQGDERIGADGEWGTADDTITISWLYLLEYDVDVLALNVGDSTDACGSLLSGVGAAGDIDLLVRDQAGAPLSGVTAQLNQSGATVTTDANGEAAFTGLSGTQDVHLFKDGHAWESFYCVAPGVDVTLQAKLASLGTVAPSSKISFQIDPTNARVSLRLLDAQGRSLDNRSLFINPASDAGTFYEDLAFDVPAGTQIDGELWAFEVDNNGRLIGAQSLGAQSYTTIAWNDYSSPREQVTVSFLASDRIPVAFSGSLVAPATDFASLTVSLGGLYSLPFVYESSLLASAATVPGVDITLPTTAQPSGVLASADNWTAWYPGAYPQINTGTFIASVVTGFQYPAIVATQEDSSANPQISWIPATQKGSDPFLSVNTIELHSAAGGAGYQSHWTIHTPAGESQVTLPSVPAGITDGMLPQSSYSIIVKTRAVPEKGYHDLIGSENLDDVDPALAIEVLSSGDVFLGPKLLR